MNRVTVLPTNTDGELRAANCLTYSNKNSLWYPVTNVYPSTTLINCWFRDEQQLNTHTRTQADKVTLQKNVANTKKYINNLRYPREKRKSVTETCSCFTNAYCMRVSTYPIDM